jgi:3-oxoacyl-[acyl-carrier-protein] synthase III
MPKVNFCKPIIKGIVSVIGPYKKKIKNEIDLYGGNQKSIERIQKSIGLNERYVVDENITSADLCETAASYMIKEMGIDRENIDGLIMVTQTPDYFQPATSAYLHGKLQLNENCAVFDINLGCSGYVYGLWMAHMMVETGCCKQVMLLAGDTISRCVNPKDRSLASLFGDAGTATLISQSEEDTPSFFSLKTDGKGYNYLIIPAGGFRKPKNDTTSIVQMDENNNYRSQQDLYMNGPQIFNFSIKTEPKAISEILLYAQLELEKIDYVIFHQANKYIINNIIRRIGVSKDKVPMETISKYGNQSSASIPTTICDAIRNEVRIKSKNLILSGFGVGLSWATCIVKLDQIYCPKVQIYKKGLPDD